MDYRKIIKFGNSSHVISIPKNWMEKNKLKKGDFVYYSENGNNELVLSPEFKEEKEEFKEININIDGKDMLRIKRELSWAYLNNYNIIQFLGKSLNEKFKEIRDEISSFMALEIMEQSSAKLVTKDYLNMKEISINELIRKMDIITRSLLSDLKKSFYENNYENISERDKDVNKFYFVILKTIRKSLNDPFVAKNLGFTNNEIFTSWHIAFHIESLADGIRRISYFLQKYKFNNKVNEKIVEILTLIEKVYAEVMKSYYTKDLDILFNLSSTKEKIIRECNEIKSKENNVELIKESLKYLARKIHYIDRWARY